MYLLDPTKWHDMASKPTIGVVATIIAFWLAVRLHRWGHSHPLLNPTLTAIIIMSICIKAAGISYADYARSATVISFMLSPAVVLLAVPLYRQRETIRRSGRIIAGALVAGFVTGTTSAVGVAWVFGADRQTLLSLAPKSTTTAIAVGISEKIGGVPALTAVLVIMTGIVGAVFGPMLAGLLGIRDQRAIGLTMGICSHGIGTARALQLNETAGAFSGLGMGLHGLLSAILLPILALAF